MTRLLLACCLTFITTIASAAGPLRVGMSADYPPLHFSQEGRYYGIEVDNLRTVGEVLSRPTEVVQLPFEQLVPALLAGDIDVIMSGLSITLERSTQVAFTDPYLQVGQMAIMHTDKLGRFSQPWSIYREGARIGVEPGTTGEAFAQRELAAAELHRYADPEAAFAALRSDEIDLYIHDAPTSWQLANTPGNGDLISLYHPLTEEQLAWAVRPDDRALLEELNRALALMKANGSLQYVLDRWIPVTISVAGPGG